MRRILRLLALLFVVLLVAAGVTVVWGYGELRGSLPQLDGRRQLAGLSAPVSVTRDGLGIPTVRAASRADAARTTGFLHAQERFFEMDLSRRRAAGELAALVGPRALPLDRAIRIHRFRTEARSAVALLSPADRAVLDAYVSGVNAGLQALEAPPFEYLVLRQTPAPWLAEDTMLVILSMFITLQDTDGSYEATLATMHDVLPEPVFEFLAPRGSEWDSPLVGPAFAVPPIPAPDVYNLRERRRGHPQNPKPKTQIPSPSDSDALGSNNFAVSGKLTADGRALLANDMHLSIRVPNTWYRASIEWSDASSASEPNRITGVTLPGVPTVVVGSNSHVAWGFTNTYADWSDIVLLETDSRKQQYLTPGGWKAFERYEETIEIAGQPPERETVSWTIWGPLLPPDYRGRARAYRWVAHSAERLAAAVTPFETVQTIEQAFDQANGLGAPGQNMLAADRSGRIGWSVYGALPRRVGLDGRLPASWADGSRRWDGWLADEEYPRIIDPPNGRLWTANARVVDGEMLAKLGDGSYEIGSRARIIRDRLFAREQFSARDLLDIQLNTRADFLVRWRTVLLDTLTPEAVANHTQRAIVRDIVEKGWSGDVSPQSVAYRLTRMFRNVLSERVVAFVLAECYEADPSFDYTTERRREAAIWRLVTEQPIHLLDPAYRSWHEMFLAALDAVIEQATREGRDDLRERVWSEYNVTTYRHPLSDAIPFSGRWLDMPDAKLPGDLYTPRVHYGSIGASERMVVSPGHEAEGIMHMPTGQSGHPLSPFYANSHPAWVAGEPTPFLPGAAQHMLTLTP